MAGQATPALYCEVCGRRETGRLRSGRRPRDLPAGFAWCTRCGSLACARCRLPAGCLACQPASQPRATVGVRRAGVGSRARPGDRWTLVAAIGAALVAASGVLALLSLPPAPPSAAIPAPVADGAGSAETVHAPSAAERNAGLVVEDSRVVTWADVLGAWHGQLISRVRNDGEVPVSVLAPDAHATITDGSHVVYEGAFDAAVPPVLRVGDAGYLIVGFPLAADAGHASAVVVPAAGPTSGVVELHVEHAAVTAEPGRLAVVGTAANDSAANVHEGIVAAVAVGQDGAPLAGFVDRASLGRLRAGESRRFRAAEPVAPPIKPAAVERLLVYAWGRRDR